MNEGRLGGASILLEGARTPAVIGDPKVLTVGGDGGPLIVPAGGFAQANPAVSAALARVVEAAARPASRGVLELFAGAGNLTVLLAREASSYTAVESEAASVDALRENLRSRGIAHAKLAVGDAEAFEIPRGAEVVVLDPPRTGAPRASEAIGASRAKEVVYVSCDPTTLARDAAKLGRAGFQAVSLDAFDMFPQTSQVEIVLAMARRR